jgi:hypothetical protein
MGIVYQNGEFQTVSGSDWVYSGGWYYYTVVTAANSDEYAKTSTLFDAVYLGNSVTAGDEIDITVYQESVYAAGYSAGDTVSVETIKDLFEN